MCQLAPVSRAGFYRSLQEAHPLEEEMAVRATIQHIALTHRRRYGYRRMVEGSFRSEASFTLLTTQKPVQLFIHSLRLIHFGSSEPLGRKAPFTICMTSSV